MCIRKEPTGSWYLRLKATQDVLPYFAAAGHNNCEKGCRLHIQECQDVYACLNKPLEEGAFTKKQK